MSLSSSVLFHDLSLDVSITVQISFGDVVIAAANYWTLESFLLLGVHFQELEDCRLLIGVSTFPDMILMYRVSQKKQFR